MKKLLLSAAFMAASFTSIAQVGVGTNTPAGALDVDSTTSGFVMPRVANTSVVVNPNGGPIENGTMVYDLSINAVNVYANGSWIGSNQSTPIVYPQTTQVASNSSGGTFTFMNYNLGANTSLDPHVPVRAIHGDYYQWGKNAPDANVDVIIGAWGSQGGSTANGNWTPTEKGPNDPCPDGFRVPSAAEWQAVHDNNAVFRTGLPWAVSTYEFGNALHFGPNVVTPALTLPTAGFRRNTTGALTYRGLTGEYWSSSENGGNAYSLYFSSSNVFPANSISRASGFSVRCIAE
jgi:uncharacterized protein (TIGR02145 family)